MSAPRAGSLLLIFSSLFLRAESITLHPVPKEVVMARLRQAASHNRDREATLKKLFEDAGCRNEWIAEQPVKHLKIPNVICTWPGSTDARILVSAHTDHVSKGDGTVDDWSGAALLPDLIEGPRSAPRRHTFVFIGFSGEEQGLVGSAFYVKQLTPWQRGKIAAALARQAAVATTLPVKWVNVEKVGRDDTEPFVGLHLPTVTFHSLTQETFPILHTPRDNLSATHSDEYCASYRLLAYYLAFIDQRLSAKPDTTVR